MKLERCCETCLHNFRKCSYLISANCIMNGLTDWTPYTNLEHLQSMDAESFAEWMEQCRSGKGVEGLMCSDMEGNCYLRCNRKNKCHPYTSTETIIKWLNSPVEVDE